MSSQNKSFKRWQNILGLSFVMITAGLLLMTTKANLTVIGIDILRVLGLLFLIFAVVLLFSSLGVFFPKKLGVFLSNIEKILENNWVVVLELSLIAVIVSWVTGKGDLSQDKWFYQPYILSLPIWLGSLLIVLLVSICYHFHKVIQKVGLWRAIPSIIGLLTIGVAICVLGYGVQKGNPIQVIVSFAIAIIVTWVVIHYWSIGMKFKTLIRLQNKAAVKNINQLKPQFIWCYQSIELMIDTHTFLANDSLALEYRNHLNDINADEFEAMNVVVNLTYDAMGSLISALRLLEYGIVADAWSLIRVAFESSCYAEYFTIDRSKVTDYMHIAETVKNNRSANVGNEVKKLQLSIQKVMKYLQERDGENRMSFYNRLCNLGTHASPVRSGLRVRVEEPEIRAYLSIGHRELKQCISDLGATIKYTLGIPFDTWPDLIQKRNSLFSEYKPLLLEYSEVF